MMMPDILLIVDDKLRASVPPAGSPSAVGRQKEAPPGCGSFDNIESVYAEQPAQEFEEK
jgi:hypothetical protein